MSDPVFPFEPNHDVREERAALGPMARRDVVASVVMIVVAAALAGVIAAAAVLMLALRTDAAAAVALFVPPILVLAAAIAVLVRLRARRRAWPFALAALVAGPLVAAIAGALWVADVGGG